MKFGIGQPVRRVEDKRFLTGQGRYVDDITLPRQAFGAVAMSPHAHANIRKIDIAAAAGAPGVICVLTARDAEADNIGHQPPFFMPEDFGGPKGYRATRPVLAGKRVHYVGERVAFVVAETAAQARDAADLIEIDYEPLPAVVEMDEAVKEGVPLVWEEWGSNVCFTLESGDEKAVEQAFARAAHRETLRVVNTRLSANPIEPRASIGVYERADDRYVLYTSSQNPHGVRENLAQAVFREAESKFRVISPDVGGGFGMKTDVYPEDALVLWASRRCGRPVKWTATRSESLLGDFHGRDQITSGTMAFDEHGKILAIRADAWHGFGAYVCAAVTAPVITCMRMMASVYTTPAIFMRSRAVFTHTAPVSVYRGAGRPEATMSIERLLDRAARHFGIDQVEIRRRNFILPEAMPYATPTMAVYDSGDFGRVMDDCLSKADWNGFAARKAASERQGKLRGRAVTCYLEQAGIFNDRMELRFDPSGGAAIVSGTHSHGQGHATVYAQIVCDMLGLPFDKIRFVQGDTDMVPYGRGTYAARSSLVGGNALKAAAESAIDKGRVMAAKLLEAPEADIQFDDGLYRAGRSNRTISFTDVAKAFFRKSPIPSPFTAGLDANASFSSEPNYPNGCHVGEVEIDPETGTVRVDRYAVVDDVGRALNPMICEGQIHGGLAQGFGAALLESIVYDRESGQLLTGSFNDYGIPRADDFPIIVSELCEIPCKTNPLGIKGVGESGTIGAPPTIVNAILDALHPLGVDDIAMPATPHRVWQAIGAARAARPKRA